MLADAQNRRNWSRPNEHHWSQGDWQSFVVPDDQPDLHYWQSGSALPDFHFANHLARAHVRAAQRIAHACLLPLLDRLRRPYPADGYPQQVPTDVANRLAEAVQGQVGP